jgi:hypothetical protein
MEKPNARQSQRKDNPFNCVVRGHVPVRSGHRQASLNEFEFRDYWRFGSNVRILNSFAEAAVWRGPSRETQAWPRSRFWQGASNEEHSEEFNRFSTQDRQDEIG